MKELSQYLGFDTYVEKCTQNCLKLTVGHPEAPQESIYIEKGQFKELCEFVEQNTDWN